VLLLADEPGQALHLAARNLPRVDVAAARMVDPVSLVRFEKVVATADALKRLEERLA
jgi:large subunit ribosomal protein L4